MDNLFADLEYYETLSIAGGEDDNILMHKYQKGVWNFNKDISNWSTNKVKSMKKMLSALPNDYSIGAKSFNQNLGNWVTDIKDAANISNFACKIPFLLEPSYYPKSYNRIQFTKAQLGCKA